MGPVLTAVRALVLDTNIVLDLLVFQDPAIRPLQQALTDNTLHWIATRPMRDELARVLTYPQIARSLARRSVDNAGTQGPPGIADPALAVLAQFDAQVAWQAVAPKAPVTCKDPDDQIFIDLAVAHQALLLSKDKEVLCMKKRLLAHAVQTQVAIN